MCIAGAAVPSTRSANPPSPQRPSADLRDPTSRATNPELIEQVRSIFPDLGEGFIAACLAVLGGPENVVSILLEGQPLPYPLDLLDRHLGAAWRKREGADRRDDDVDQKEYVAMQKQYIRHMEREQVCQAGPSPRLLRLMRAYENSLDGFAIWVLTRDHSQRASLLSSVSPGTMAGGSQLSHAGVRR
jgi:hypothetical protein